MKTTWKLVETCILPIIIYAAETWIPTKTEVEHIYKILDKLKRILQAPPSILNEIIHIETEVWDIEKMIEEKQIMYYHRIHNNPTGLRKQLPPKKQHNKTCNTTIKTPSENTIWDITQL